MVMDRTTATDWLKKQGRKVVEHTTLDVTEEKAATVEVEAWLQRREVKYAPAVAIPMAMIDERRSRQNQARKDPLVAESVERFANSFRQGRPFPPIVVYQLGNKLVIIDGNNRHEAAKRAKLPSILGIIIDDKTPSELIQLLTVEANNGHGVTPDPAWRTRQANHLVTLGFSDSDAAEAAGVSLSSLRSARSAAEADGRARRLGIYGFGDLAQTTKVLIGVLKSDPVFLEVARFVVAQKVSQEQVRDLVREVKKGRSEAEMLATLKDIADQMDVEAATKKALKKGVSSPKNALVSGVGLITKCDPAQLIRQIVTTHDRDVIKRRLDEAVDKILELQVAMESLDGLES